MDGGWVSVGIKGGISLYSFNEGGVVCMHVLVYHKHVCTN